VDRDKAYASPWIGKVSVDLCMLLVQWGDMYGRKHFSNYDEAARYDGARPPRPCQLSAGQSAWA